MSRPLLALFAATLTSACGSPHAQPPAAAAQSNAAQAHGHGHGGHHGQPHGSGAHPSFADARQWTKVFDDPERDVWQRPDEVVAALGLTATMKVADVGAGTGYFAVRLARAVPHGAVLGTDLEPDMVRFLNERAQRERLPNLRGVQVAAGATGLAPQSLDRILIVNVWHHLSERVQYARELGAALRGGGQLFVVEFKLDAHRGPPPAMRLAPQQVIAELESAGLSAQVSSLDLPEQYVIQAWARP